MRAVVPILILFLCGLGIPAEAQEQARAAIGPLRISGIVIEGNKVTKERVVLRELTLQEGDTVDGKELYARIERSTQNLRNLSLFNSVTIMPLFLSASEVFLTVTVNERWYWWPEPIFRVADPNFNTWWLTRDFRRVNWGAFLNRHNFRGLNETILVKFQFGYTKEFGLRYRIPFVDKRERWGVSIGASYAEQNEVTVGTVGNKRVFARYDDKEVRTERKVDVQGTLRRAHDKRHNWRAAYVDATVRDTVRRYTGDYFRGNGTRASYFALGYTFAHDRRDSRVYPLSGRYVEGRVDRYGLGLLGTNEPLVTVVQGALEQHWRVHARWSVGASVRGRTTLEDRVPYYNQEGLGYANYVRGYEYYVIDGQHAAVGKANVLFALMPPREYYLEPVPLEAFRTLYIAIYLNAFADVGRAWDDRRGLVNPLANTWLHGYGLGLDLVSSYDQVLRLEYSRNGLAETGFYLHFSQPF
jgi:outer membrane protein assembly factor BamA